MTTRITGYYFHATAITTSSYTTSEMTRTARPGRARILAGVPRRVRRVTCVGLGAAPACGLCCGLWMHRPWHTCRRIQFTKGRVFLPLPLGGLVPED